MNLHNLIGATIQALIPIWSSDQTVQSFKLHGVEAGGIWVENQQLTDKILNDLGAATASTTVVLFVPYHQISFVVGLVDQPSLSEKALGL